MKRLWQLFDWLDGIEFAVCGIIAAALLVGGPVYLFVRFVAAHHYVQAVCLGLLWCVCLAAGIRDVRRKRFSWITGILVAAWFVATLWVGMGLG